jgi:hemerythrin-like domain-containing protein
MPAAVGRRRLLETSLSAAGALALSACGSPAPKPGPAQAKAKDSHDVPVTPPEDLMREHGVLKRILLIYREGIGRLQSGDQDALQALHTSAGIIRSFIEDYHEHLEEQYVFPKLEQAHRLTDLTAVLRLQHQRGRAITDRMLSATATPAALAPSERDGLVQDASAFIRMYEPHEAREDTVVFPALREVLIADEFRELAETFEDEEHRRFGPAGFEGVVGQVADIEKRLDIYDLARFTPA